MKKLKKLMSGLTACAVLAFAVPASSLAGGGDSIEDALAIKAGKQYSGEITDNDTEDFYKIVLPSSGYVKITIDGTLEQCNLQLLTEDEEKVFSEDINTSGSKGSRLNKGTYYVKVTQLNSKTGTYSLKARFESANESFEETGSGTDNTLASASHVDVNKEYTGQFAYNEHFDCYEFEIERSGFVKFHLETAMKRILFEAYAFDSDSEEYKNLYIKTPPFYDINDGIMEEEIYLNAGKYGIRLSRETNGLTGVYNFTIDYTDMEESFSESGWGENNSFDTASPIELNKTCKGQLSKNDECDYYKFTIDEPFLACLTYSGNPEGSRVYFYTDTTTEFTHFSNYGEEAKEEFYLSGGTYYIKAEKIQPQRTGTYSLTMDVYTLGDVNRDGNVDAVDASLVLSAYATAAVNGGDNGLNKYEVYTADVNKDTNVDAVDASFILSYYAYHATGGTDTFRKYMENNK